MVIVLTPEAIASGITQQEWRYARQRGVVVYPVKGVPDQRLDYAALPNWMRKVHFFDIGQFTRGEWRESKEWETFVSYLKSDREPNRVPFMAPDLPAGFVPRERERDQLLQLLLEPRGGKPVAATAALIGAGGYGKTTLAIALCHDERVIEAFDDGVLWTSLGETPRLVDELTKLYEALTGQRPAFVDATQAAASLAGKLEHRNCLLVIDDVWERVHLDPFLKGGKQCARLVTTRRFDLAHGAARVRVNEMSAEESLRMLGTAFSPGAISDARLAPMARRLGEWPLLLKLAAGMIGRRLDRGDSADGALAYVEQVLDKRGVTAFDQDNATQRDEAVRRTVGASLDQLSVEDARRFHDLAIFPEDTRIPLTTLQRLWGLDALDAADCAQRLDDVSLLSLDLPREVIVLHDMMRAYLVQTLDDAARVQARLVAAYQDLEHLPDLYAWRWLPYHMREAGQIADLRELLLRPAWLHAKLRATSPDALIGDFDFVPGDGDLDAVQAALRLALSSLAADPNQLWEQLLGRLPLALSPRLERLRRDLTRSAPRPRLHARWPNLQGPGGGLLQTLVGHRESINGARLLPDGRVLSWSCDDTLRIWDLTTGENLALIGHQGIVLGALVLPDGRVLSWSEDATLRVWDLATGEALALTGHRRLVRRALLLPDGRVVSSSDDSTLRIWDLATGQARTLSGHRGRVFEALLLPDGRVLSRSEDGTLRVWDLPTGESHTLSGHEGLVLGALLLPDGAVLSWSDDTTLRVWNPTTGEGRALTGHEGPVRGALRLLDGCVLSWAEEPLLRIWNLATGEGRALSGHEWQSVGGALLLPDGRVLSWSADGTRMWNPATGESRAVTGHQGSVSGALLLPDGRVLSWGDGYILRVEDIATGEGSSLIGHEKSITGAALLPSGRVLSWSADQTLKLWEVGMGLGGAVTGHHRPVEGALLLQAGRMLSWSRDSLRVCDLTTGEATRC